MQQQLSIGHKDVPVSVGLDQQTSDVQLVIGNTQQGGFACPVLSKSVHADRCEMHLQSCIDMLTWQQTLKPSVNDKLLQPQ